MSHIILSFSQWAQHFHPIPNHLDDSATFAGYAQNSDRGILFDTHGQQLTHVMEIAAVHPELIWTLYDNHFYKPSDTLMTSAGFRFATDHDQQTYNVAEGDIIDSAGQRITADYAGEGLHLFKRLGYFITEMPAARFTSYEIIDDNIFNAIPPKFLINAGRAL